MPKPFEASDDALADAGVTGPAGPWSSQVAELGRLLAQARSDIAAVAVGCVDNRWASKAQDELDAIALQTATATHTILDACEAIDPLAATMDGSIAAQMQAATTRIYEACGFHDLVGQRISRVLETLQTIDAKIATIIGNFGIEPFDETGADERPAIIANADCRAAQVALINGPQSDRVAMRQVDVDRLMAGG